MNVIIAALVLGLLGLLFSFLLTAFYRRFAVKSDPRLEELTAILPGSNCGACGKAGCAGLAEAALAGQAEVTGCVAGGAAVAGRVAAFMGVSLRAAEDQVAWVGCRAGRSVARMKYAYEGVELCQAANLLFGGDKLCPYGCLGLGSCVRACPFGAIRVTGDGVAVVDHQRCRGCRKCVAACPRSVITMVPKSHAVEVACSSRERGRRAAEICGMACTACRVCEKACPEAAIAVTDNLPIIDHARCTGCGVCVEKCPQKTLQLAARAPVERKAASE
jgi:Na+-translocating ferredoxin:NAD+ oxidoreductase subunit B